MKRIFVFGIVLIVLSSALITFINVNEVKGESKSGYTPHSPIYINGNEDFTSANGVSSGDGSQGNPYIIEGWDILANIDFAGVIDIRNTTVYFKIKNVYVHAESGFGYGIYLKNVKNGTIEKSEIKTNNWGIKLSFSSNNTINNINSNGTGICVSELSNNNTIIGNNIYSSDGYGVFLSFSSNHNIITNNNISNNYEGIHLSTSSSNNTINNNNISFNDFYGISLDSSNNNTIINNIVYSNNMAEAKYNNYGIRLHSSSNNYIYLNNFIDNKNQAYDDGDNSWNYNSKGNYWSDYSGTDSNSDGIGDTPYSISGGNNKDNFPLMKPINNFTTPNQNQQNQNPTTSEPKNKFSTLYIIIGVIVIIIVAILISFFFIRRNKLKSQPMQSQYPYQIPQQPQQYPYQQQYQKPSQKQTQPRIVSCPNCSFSFKISPMQTQIQCPRCGLSGNVGNQSKIPQQPQQYPYQQQYQQPQQQYQPQNYQPIPQNITCPNCQSSFQVSSQIRPLQIQCPYCGTKGGLRI